ncbi:MAG: diaminopimelate epimerase [Myxococcales bacterium]|nr:diaminopimelate epimerase [Myxococcales bacterium]USN50381.1 MAG: diaminopimelate epimerase [Myxococcales bacterium]
MHEKPLYNYESINENSGLSFTKYNANGNDFIIIEGEKISSSLRQQIDWLVKRASFLCDRHRGIGADGILLVDAAGDTNPKENQKTKQNLMMHVINADGSIAQNCGNGLRCAAQWGFKRQEIVGNILDIELGQRTYTCTKKAHYVSVDMGECLIDHIENTNFLGQATEVYKASLGNDHLVFVFEKEYEAEAMLAVIKQNYYDWENFNLGFVSRGTRRSMVHERGVGFTKSCGSGAIAAAMALAMHDDISSTTIHQLGGDIFLKLDPLVCSRSSARFRITQSGAAVEVFCGHIEV